MTNINDFNSYAKVFSKQNQYDIVLNLPTIPLPTGTDEKTIRLFARGLSVPSTSTTISEQNIMNQKRVSLSTTVPDSVIVSFLDTTTLFFHRFFNEWEYKRIDAVTGLLQYYPEDIMTNIDIFNYNKKVYSLVGCFPTSVGDFRLEDDSVNQFGTFDVTFYVNKLEIQDIGFSSGE